MVHTTRTKALPLALVLLAVGCSVPRQAREDANLLAAYTTKVKADAERYRAFRDDLAKARRDNMHVLERDTLELQQETAVYVGAWDAAEDEQRVRLYNAVLAATKQAAEQQAELRELLAKQQRIRAETKTLFAVRSQKLQETAKALAALGKEPGYRDQARFLVDFFKQVRTSIDQANAGAEEEAKAGKAEAETSAQSEESN